VLYFAWRRNAYAGALLSRRRHLSSQPVRGFSPGVRSTRPLPAVGGGLCRFGRIVKLFEASCTNLPV